MFEIKVSGPVEKSAGGPAHSKTLRARGAIVIRASVLECAGPPPLYFHGMLLFSSFTFHPAKWHF
jgi:hypothetical protein